MLAGCRWQAAQERFREGRKHLQTLSAKLTDLAVLGIALDEKNLFDGEYLAHRSEACEESKHRRFAAVLVHLVSLLHGVALGTLSGDLTADNIEVLVAPQALYFVLCLFAICSFIAGEAPATQHWFPGLVFAQQDQFPRSE